MVFLGFAERLKVESQMCGNDGGRGGFLDS